MRVQHLGHVLLAELGSERLARRGRQSVKKQEGRELTGIDARSVPDLRPTLSHLVFSTALLSTYDYPHFINGNLKVHKV